MDNYAIIVGIDDYSERPLKGAVNDAQAFADWLVESGQVLEAEKKLRIKLITSDQFPEQSPPTDVEINLAVKDIYRTISKTPAQKAKRLYFYFSGHGMALTYTSTALCLRPWDSFLNTYCISSQKYLDGLVQLKMVEELVFIFDCCRDVDVLIDAIGPRWNQPALSNIDTKFIVCFSTKYAERSQEVEVKDTNIDFSKRRGAFTKFLIDALNGDADNGNGEIKAFHLFEHLQNHFKSYTASLRYIQEASFIHNLTSDILIHKVGASNSTYNFEVKFSRASSNIELQDGSFQIKKKGTVSPGDIWQIDLEIGVHLLIDHDKPKGDPLHEKYVQNHSKKTVTHEQF